MKLSRKSVVPALGGMAALLFVIAVLGKVSATSATPCPASDFPLSLRSPSIRQQCTQLKDQAQRNVMLTAEARPYATSVPRPVGTYTALAAEGPPVATRVPPGQLPPDVQQIKPLDSDPFGRIGGHPVPITSIWQLGGIPSPSQPGYGWLILDAWGPNHDTPTPRIARELFLIDGMPDIRKQVNPAWANTYSHIWGCPRAIGQITITNVTGANGVVSFMSTSRISGTLDMSTGTWTFSQ